jgi:hypothetical protein
MVVCAKAADTDKKPAAMQDMIDLSFMVDSVG